MTAYPKYKPSGIPWLGDIPEGWDERKIFGLFVENKQKNGALVYRRAMQFNYGRLIDKNERLEEQYISSIYSKYSLIKKDDIVINGLNLNYDMVSQRVAISPKDGIITSAYVVIRPRTEICPKYFCYLFKGMDSKKLFHGMGNGIRLTLAYKELRNQVIPLPPLPEQEAIVAYLDDATAKIDKAIAAEERMIELLQERKQIIINQAVTRGLDPNVKLKPSGISWLGDIPEGWEIRPLKSCFTSSFSGIWGEEPREGLEVAVCWRVADFDYERGCLKEDKLTNRGYRGKDLSTRFVKEGDLLLEKSGGGDLSPVGRMVRVNKSYRATCSNFMQQFRCNNLNSSSYLFYVFKALYAKKINGYFYNQTIGIQNLKVAEYIALKFPLPSFSEQMTIVAYLDTVTNNIDKAIEVKRRQIELLRERREIIIDDVVTGKVKVA